MVNHMRTFFLLLLSITFLHAPTTLLAKEIKFRWAILLDAETSVTPLDFSSTPVLQNGDMLQLYFHSEKETYLYIFLHDSSNIFTPIFPEPHYYNYPPPTGEIRIPEGQDRFAISPPGGIETFYLLASDTRLTELEKAMENYYNDPDNIDNQAILFQEVRLLRRSKSKLSQITERGIPVSGTRRNIARTRGREKVEQFEATQVIAEGFYSKLLRLSHE